jgi:hypothetical protein
MGSQLQELEAEVAQIQINVWNILRHLMPEDRWDLVPWGFSFLFSVVLNYNLIIWATFRQFTFIPIVSLWLATFIEQNHFYVVMLNKQGSCYFQSLHFSYMLQEDFVQISRQWRSSPLHPSGRCGFPSGRSSIKHHLSGWRELSVRTPNYVQMLWTIPSCILPDISATCPDAFQCSTSKQISFQNTDMGRQLQTIWTTWLFRPGAILDKASRAEDVQPSRCQTPLSGRSGLNMKIACSRSAIIRTLGQHCSNAALFRKEYSANLESQLHSCLSRRPQLPSGCHLGKSYQSRFWFSVAYK